MKPDDFQIDQDGKIRSGKPLTARRIRAIVQTVNDQAAQSNKLNESGILTDKNLLDDENMIINDNESEIDNEELTGENNVSDVKSGSGTSEISKKKVLGFKTQAKMICENSVLKKYPQFQNHMSGVVKCLEVLEHLIDDEKPLLKKHQNNNFNFNAAPSDLKFTGSMPLFNLEQPGDLKSENSPNGAITGKDDFSKNIEDTTGMKWDSGKHILCITHDNGSSNATEFQNYLEGLNKKYHTEGQQTDFRDNIVKDVKDTLFKYAELSLKLFDHATANHKELGYIEMTNVSPMNTIDEMLDISTFPHPKLHLSNTISVLVSPKIVDAITEDHLKKVMNKIATPEILNNSYNLELKSSANAVTETTIHSVFLRDTLGAVKIQGADTSFIHGDEARKKITGDAFKKIVPEQFRGFVSSFAMQGGLSLIIEENLSLPDDPKRDPNTPQTERIHPLIPSGGEVVSKTKCGANVYTTSKCYISKRDKDTLEIRTSVSLYGGPGRRFAGLSKNRLYLTNQQSGAYQMTTFDVVHIINLKAGVETVNGIHNVPKDMKLKSITVMDTPNKSNIDF